MDVAKLCRSCMKEVASWEVDNFEQKAVDMFRFCTNIETTSDDKLPRQFCYDCTIQIESSYTFITKAQETNVKLKNLVSRLTTSVIVETDKHIINDLNSNFDNNLNIRLNTFSENSLFDNFENANSTLDDLNTDLESIIVPNKANIEDVDIIKSEKKMESKEETKEICPVCKKVFVMKSWLEKHMKSKHCSKGRLKTQNDSTIDKRRKDDVNQYEKETKNAEDNETKVCPLCRKTFTSKLWFSRHMKEHNYTKQYTCPHCPKSFITYHQLRYHSELHADTRVFSCCTCAKRFKTRKQLAAHAPAHRDARPYACDKCDMRFKIKSVLTCHMKVHEKDKPFLCYICGWGFSQGANLACHMRKHTGEKPYACSQCSFRAAAACNLKRHERRHRGEQNYVCAHCQKRFYDSGSLGRHARTHTGERPFKCPNCALAFLDSWKRKTHMMRTHQLALADIPRLDRDGRPAASL